MTDPLQENLRARDALTRRHFLARSGLGLGALSLGELALSELAAADEPLAARPPTRKAKAKQVIYLHMAGAPPQHDTFDPKPKLQELSGDLCPRSFIEGKRLAFIKGHPTLLGSPYKLVRRDPQGILTGELIPHMSGLLDDITLVRSMHTDQFNHAPADLKLFTGSPTFGAASMGSWVTYGLGSMNRDLPGYVVMVSGGSDPTGGKSIWGSGFLPSVHQGVRLRSSGDPILYVSDPAGMDRSLRRRTLDALRSINSRRLEDKGDPETRTRIEQYELAFRMQTSVPELMDISRESREVHELYGSRPGESSFANHCLLARRLVEAGVRFVHLFDWGWDIHGTGPHDDLITMFPQKCQETDRPVAALVRDLDRRGLLDETLVVWGGEFGRTSMNEARGGSKFLGRDHHPDCFSMWMAGGGVQRGLVYGETDELGYTITRDPVSITDLQATILHLLGLDPHEMAYPYKGLSQRLVGPSDEFRVVHEIIA